MAIEGNFSDFYVSSDTLICKNVCWSFTCKMTVTLLKRENLEHVN